MALPPVTLSLVGVIAGVVVSVFTVTLKGAEILQALVGRPVDWMFMTVYRRNKPAIRSVWPDELTLPQTTARKLDDLAIAFTERAERVDELGKATAKLHEDVSNIIVGGLQRVMDSQERMEEAQVQMVEIARAQGEKVAAAAASVELLVRLRPPS